MVDHQIGSALQRKRVYGNIFRSQRNGLTQTALKALHRVARQACDQIHIDIRMPYPASDLVAFQNICRCMAAANAPQHIVRKGLRIDRNTGSAVFLDHAQFFFVCAIRAARFYGVFLHLAQIKTIFHRAHQLPQLVCRKRSGRTTADINAFQMHGILIGLLVNLFHLTAQAIHIGLHERTVFFYRA